MSFPGYFEEEASGAGAEAFPILEGVASYVGSMAATTSVPLPSGIVAGDLLLLVTTLVEAATVRTSSAPSGWQQLYASGGGGALRDAACYYRYATGSEGSSVSLSASGTPRGGSVLTARVSGAQGQPQVSVAGSAVTGSPNPPELSPAWGSKATLWLAIVHKEGSPAPTAVPDGFTDAGQASTTSNNGSRTVLTKAELKAPSLDPTPFSFAASSASVTRTVAIQPV
ncbi:hypothetical protein SAMN02983003_0615 [Devosia enhydra]|uniref:Uncharacterized protein n=1 Tax=Devosia enhydra TaxID=665118 RepID=A0A1K2HVA4_9HYPH|nr:hypothetical protein [Devosia enhydra]SFZ81651.1 hypothetical protein SAMN02983003_0615 [Devosia enhydra]